MFLMNYMFQTLWIFYQRRLCSFNLESPRAKKILQFVVQQKENPHAPAGGNFAVNREEFKAVTEQRLKITQHFVLMQELQS